MYPFYFDPSIIILIPSIIITLYAQFKVQSTFAQYSKVPSLKGYTGAQVARMLLDSEGLFDVPVEMISGSLSDHYDPRKKAMRLSNEVYNGTSVASLGVAAHETGHAIQDKNGYTPLVLRNSIAPVVNIGSQASWPIIIIGLLFGFKSLIEVGIILFSAVVLFQLVTLPVEFNASNRALKILSARGILMGNEIDGARRVLRAAALTYVASAFAAISQLARLIYINRER